MREIAGVVITTVLSVLVVINIAGNSLVCAIIRKHRDMRTPINFLVVNLAVADILFGAFIAPKLIFSVNLQHPEGFIGTAICKLLTGGILAWVGAACSAITLATIAVERYCAVIYPYGSKWQLTKRKVQIVIGVSWLISFLHNIPLFMNMKVDNNLFIDRWPQQWLSQYFTLACNVVVFIPLAMMVALYSRIVYTLWFKQNHSNVLSPQQQGVVRLRKRITLMVATVSVIYGICWGTIQVLYTLWRLTSFNMGPVLIAITNTMILFNSAVNPFVYALLNKNFREKMKGMVCCSRAVVRPMGHIQRNKPAENAGPAATQPTHQDQQFINISLRQ